MIKKHQWNWGSMTYVVGVINATPDSFSGDGVAGDSDMAIERALRFVEEGAHMIDVGGESSRPPDMYRNVQQISAYEEIKRVVPVVEGIARRSDVPISIDTCKSEVAQAAISVGASVINDVWGFKKDKDMSAVAAISGVDVILTHNSISSSYCDVVKETIEELSDMVESAIHDGVSRSSIIIDPGFGFGGKSPSHNLEVLRRLDEYQVIGRPIMIGTSRKSTIGKIIGAPVTERIEGTSATIALAIAKGVDLVRVHDVRQMALVSRMSDAVVRGWDDDRLH